MVNNPGTKVLRTDKLEQYMRTFLIGRLMTLSKTGTLNNPMIVPTDAAVK